MTVTAKGQQLRADIIKQLYYRKALSLTEISKRTKKSLPLITTTVNMLIKEQYIIEQGLAPSTGGRRAQTFLLNPKKEKYVVAVAMDQLTTRMVIYNLAQEIVMPVKNLDLDIQDQDAVAKLSQFINRQIEVAGLAKNQILGVGIGMPGFVNITEGINYSCLKPADGSNLRQYLAQALGLPVHIDNDSSLIALAELNFGVARDKKDVLVVNIGWGTGLGMIVNGGLYRGSSGYAGEFSHIPLSKTSNLCSCGKVGCLEVDTSLLVMVANAEKALAEGSVSIMSELFKDEQKHKADHFLDAVVKRDPLAIAILSDAAFQIGKGLATLIHIMNPESIVLSGRGAKAGKMLLPAIEQAINEFCIPRIAEKTTIVLSKLIEDAELMASASLVIAHSLFN
ncbi:ROK family protein [Pedobacter sp. KR3-3]|uniref:ROK family protein n=1 Tax=Pedobacter albus TaxID=3113905 RepID=A0ABU7I778_9SPHI|nr:ROK family protein [Pedobacter sp. KR3-3]MEE1945329.1 ROK family protein [Pedobacter sp. KR3-3]